MWKQNVILKICCDNKSYFEDVKINIFKKLSTSPKIIKIKFQKNLFFPHTVIPCEPDQVGSK